MFLTRIDASRQTRDWISHGDALICVSPAIPDSHALVALLGSFARAAPDPGAYGDAVRCPDMPVEFTTPTCDPHVVKTSGFAVNGNRVPWPDFCDVAGSNGCVAGEHFLKPIEHVPADWRRL